MWTGAAHILRPKRTPTEIAQRFGAFCKDKSILTRGMVRIGATPRGIRGATAAKDIEINESVIIVPDKAFLSVFDAFRSDDFVDVCGGSLPLVPDSINERIASTVLFTHQIILGYYAAHVMLVDDDAASNQFTKYLDFLPRGEGNFSELQIIIERSLDAWPENERLEEALAKRHRLSLPEVRGMVHYALTMVISRALPIEHKKTLTHAMKDTDFVELLAGEPDQTRYSIPIMCPLLDMVNHSPDENVAVMVPDDDSKDFAAVVARSMRKIRKGEEIVMTYGINDPYGMQVFYGIDPSMQHGDARTLPPPGGF